MQRKSSPTSFYFLTPEDLGIVPPEHNDNASDDNASDGNMSGDNISLSAEIQRTYYLQKFY